MTPGAAYTPALHTGLFLFLTARQDVENVRFALEEIDLRLVERDALAAPGSTAVATIRLEHDELKRAWPKLTDGVSFLQLGRDPDLPELGPYILLNTHVEEAVHSLREPGPRGFRYLDGQFEAW